MRYKKLKTLFLELCTTLKPKLEYVENSMEYVEVGEYTLALEFISDWCIDEVPRFKLTVNELLKIKEIGDQVSAEGAWIELLPLLTSFETRIFSEDDLERILFYIDNQLIKSPSREKWLSRIRESIKINK